MFEFQTDDLLRLQKRAGGPVPEGMLPVGLEYAGPHGTISAFYCGQPAPRLLESEDAAALGGVTAVQLRESADHTWQLRLCGSDPEHAAQSPADAQAVQALLQKFDLLPLPGMA